MDILHINLRTSVKSLLVISFTLGLGLCAKTAFAEPPSVPKDHKGVTVGLLEELPKETLERTVGLKGYTLRMRWVTVEAGGRIAEHSHADRPGIVSMVDGKWWEGLYGSDTMFSSDGYQSFPETEKTVHWVYNHSDKPSKALVCDIVKTK